MERQDGNKLPLTKARQLNESGRCFGTIAEIGAGLGVISLFFDAGGARMTVAKGMTAYSMAVSDDIYCEGFPDAHRIPYTNRYRLKAMLEHEYCHLVKRFLKNKRNAKALKKERGGEFPCLFCYANTFSTGDNAGYAGKRNFHGWMGVRVLSRRDGEFAGNETDEPHYVDVLVHVVLLEESRKGQYDTIGAMGVNLIEAAWRLLRAAKPVTAVERQDLVDSIFGQMRKTKARVDVLEINPSAEHQKHCTPMHNNRELSLFVVNKDLSYEVLLSSYKSEYPAELGGHPPRPKPGVNRKKFQDFHRAEFDKWRPKLDRWHAEQEFRDGSNVDSWAYPADDLCVPIRFLSGKNVCLIAAKVDRKKMSFVAESLERMNELCGDDALPILVIRKDSLLHGEKFDFTGFDEAYKNWIKRHPRSAVLVTRCTDLGWATESLRRSMIDCPGFNVILDKKQWKDLASDDTYKRLHKKNGAADEVAAALASRNPIHCLQRLETAGCNLVVLDNAGELPPAVEQYVKYLSTNRDKIRFVPSAGESRENGG